MGAEFIEVQKAGPSLSPSPPGVTYASAYAQLYSLAATFMRLYKQVSWVKACVDLIADATTSESYIIKQVAQQDELDDQAENPRIKALQTVFDNINPEYDLMELTNKNIRALQINGTSYNRILRKAGSKQIVGMEYIRFTRVKPNVNDSGELVSWSIKGKRGSAVETVRKEDVAVFKLAHPDDDIIGLSPLESLDLPLGVDIQAQRFNEAAFRNGPYASLILSMSEADPDEVERNREYIKNNFTKPENAHKPMFLEGDVKVIGDSLQRRGVDGSFIELRKFNREEICAVFRVPVTKLITDGANRSNTEEHDETFVRDTIEPLQRLYWQQFNRRILQREFGITDMIVIPGKKQDVTMTNINIAKGMVQSGATGNEARKVMNLNSIDGYDVPMFAITVTPETDAESTTNQSKNQQAVIKPVPPQNVKKATATADAPDDTEDDTSQDDEEPEDTKQDEEEFAAAYIVFMASIRRRMKQAVSIHDLLRSWTPTTMDVQQSAESLFELYKNVWLSSYNRRRLETGGEPLKELPRDVSDRLVQKAVKTADGIFETYHKELVNKLQSVVSDVRDLTPSDQFDKVQKDVSDWLKNRMQYKAKEIATQEAGDVWNDALFTHDAEFAPDTEYTVRPLGSDHAACLDIIMGAPYTKDTIPASLPLHPNCPHRYYAIVDDAKEVRTA